MNIGDRHPLDNVLYEIVSIGALDEDGDFDVEEGRVPEPEETGMVLLPDDEPGRAYWMQPVTEVEQRARVASLEMEVDFLLGSLRATLIEYEDKDEDVPVSVVASLMRASCSVGYMHGLREEPRGALALRAGYDAGGNAP